jgi:hypothetical protein
MSRVTGIVRHRSHFVSTSTDAVRQLAARPFPHGSHIAGSPLNVLAFRIPVPGHRILACEHRRVHMVWHWRPFDRRNERVAHVAAVSEKVIGCSAFFPAMPLGSPRLGCVGSHIAGDKLASKPRQDDPTFAADRISERSRAALEDYQRFDDVAEFRMLRNDHPCAEPVGVVAEQARQPRKHRARGLASLFVASILHFGVSLLACQGSLMRENSAGLPRDSGERGDATDERADERRQELHGACLAGAEVVPSTN